MKLNTNAGRQCAAGLLLIVCVCALVSCSARPGPFDDWIRADDAHLWEGAESSAWRDAPSASDEPAPVVAGDADVEAYVRIALTRNPGIRAAEQNVAAMAQRIPQATSLDDPTLDVAPIGNMAETAAGSVSVTTGISQRFPLGGKLRAAGKAAEAEVAVAIAQWRAKRLAVAGDVRRAYWNLYQAARALEVLQENKTILEQFKSSAEAMYKTGRTTQQDVLRVGVEIGELDAEHATLSQQADSARAMLNQLMDRPMHTELPLPPAATLDELSLELSSLVQSAMQTNPSLAQIEAGIDADRQRVRLARLQRIPDVNVSFSYNIVDDSGLSPVSNGEDQWWVGFGINLPIWHERLDAAEREAQLNALRGLSALAQERNSVSFRIQDALLTAQAAHRRALLFRDVILPQARQALDTSLSSYRAGKIDSLNVSDNRRRLLEFELMLHESIAQLNRALADIRQLTGAEASVGDAHDGDRP